MKYKITFFLKTIINQLLIKEWEKHWFVLSGQSMKYYHDSQAESDEKVNGVIDIRDCTDVVQADLAKNYGFIIQVNQIVTLEFQSYFQLFG